MRFPIPLLAVASLVLVSQSFAAEVQVASETRPALIDQIEFSDGMSALAISPDGTRVAYALPPAEPSGNGVLVMRVAGSDRAVIATVPGIIRDLLFPDDSGSVLGLQYLRAKRGQGDTFLFTWNGMAKLERVMRVPPSANDLDLWPGGNAILMACRNEIRTLLPPAYRSGPLFSFPGDNFAVTSLGNSSLVVVGQAEGLFLLDLAAPSGRESMPVLASRELPDRVSVLADDSGGDGFWVQLVDGQVFRAAFEPPGFDAVGTVDRLVGWKKAPRAPVMPAAIAHNEPPPAPIEPVVEPPVTVADAVVPENVAPETPPPAVPDKAPTPETRPAPPETVEPDEPAAAPATRQVEGRVLGALDLVQSVVLLGPDNILREAARVRLDSQGRWAVDGLDPGRYRIQLDAGGDRVLVARPRFLMVEVGATPTRAPDLTAVESF